MKQRVGFARALAVEPEILFMDEPFSALDVLTAENLRGELLELWLGKKIPTQSIFLVTHNIEEAVHAGRPDHRSGPQSGEASARIFASHAKHPRERTSAEFLLYVDYIYKLMTQPHLDARPPRSLARRKAGPADAAARAPGRHRRIARAAATIAAARTICTASPRNFAWRWTICCRSWRPPRCFRSPNPTGAMWKSRRPARRSPKPTSTTKAPVPRSRARPHVTLLQQMHSALAEQVGPHDAARVLPRPPAGAFLRERDRAADRDGPELGALWRNSELFPRGDRIALYGASLPGESAEEALLKQRPGTACPGAPPWSARSATLPSLWKDLPILVCRPRVVLGA